MDASGNAKDGGMLHNRNYKKLKIGASHRRPRTPTAPCWQTNPLACGSHVAAGPKNMKNYDRGGNGKPRPE
jgi:hypothetical protein